MLPNQTIIHNTQANNNNYHHNAMSGSEHRTLARLISILLYYNSFHAVYSIILPYGIVSVLLP